MTSSKIVNKTISISAPVSIVWDALTNPEVVKEWLSAEGTTHIISDWKVGSPLIFAGTWHRKKYEDKGTILQLDAENVLEYSYWSRFSKLPDSPENYSVIGFRLTPGENCTTLTVTHGNFAIEEMYGHANFYWRTALVRIKKVLEEQR